MLQPPRGAIVNPRHSRSRRVPRVFRLTGQALGVGQQLNVPGTESDVIGKRRLQLAVKRGIDVVGAATAGIFLAPVLAWTALAVALMEGLPILFRQKRPGRDAKPFVMYKFRTMRPPCRGEVWYLTDERRMTRLGRFLRSTSLDELPELWNVLRGDMSLVGPRPLLMEYVDEYAPEERRRHDMRPGVTGWAIVNGRNTLMFRDRLKLDVWYVDHWSLALDLRILAVTAYQVVRRTNQYPTEDLALGFPLPGIDPSLRQDGVQDSQRRE